MRSIVPKNMGYFDQTRAALPRLPHRWGRKERIEHTGDGGEPLVLQDLERQGLADYSIERIADLTTRFAAYAEQACGVNHVDAITPSHVRGFVAAPIGRGCGPRDPSIATMHLRRAAVRLYFQAARSLRLCQGDPSLDLALPRRSSLATRALTDEEVVLCRSASLRSLTETRSTAAWALAEATARTSEIPHIRAADVDLHAERVWLHGSNKVLARWARRPSGASRSSNDD